jgi:hypothetical protein
MDERSKGRTHVRRNEEEQTSKVSRPKWLPPPRVLIGLVVLVAVFFLAFHVR